MIEIVMTQLADQTHTFMRNLQQFEVPQPANAHLEQLRARGLARFKEVGFPTTRDEEWRYTNVAPIARASFKAGAPDDSADISRISLGRHAAAEVVFINGQFSARLSRLSRLPAGVTVLNLPDADPALLERHLARHVAIESTPFAALNTALIHDGAFIHLARGTQLQQPIHLIFLSTASREPTASHPRVLIVADAGVNASIVESYHGSGAGSYLTNAVTEITAAEDAVIDHCRLQQESLEAFHVSSTTVHLARSADFISHSASLGAKLSRNDLNVILDGEYAHATLNGLVLLSGDQHCDNHTLLRHEKPNCPSHELYKHVLDGRSSGVFKGKIFVQKDAQKTDSKQTSKSLLLSDDAVMNSMPALEIYADDVKCTHGSTSGPVDEDMLFYIRTRGVSFEAARHLLTYAFAADITRRIRIAPVRARLEDFMAAQHGLPQDLRITDIGSHDEAAL